MNQADSELLSDAAAMACAARRNRLRQRLTDLQLDALLISSEKDIQYLTGFVGHDSLLVITPDPGPAGAVIISDSRYDEFLDPWRKANAAEVVMGTRHRLNGAVDALCKARAIHRLGIQAEHVTLVAKAKLGQAVGDSKLIETLELISTLRRRKDELEVDAIERAIALQQEALATSLNHIAIAMTELEFSAVLEFEMKSRGSYGTGFSPIIGAQANSSVIHHMSGHTPIEPGVLLVDWGATMDGYNGDLTRTFGVGHMPAKIREIYPIVLEAQLAAIDCIAPSRTCAEVDAVARGIITSAGYGEYFGHGLGHGLGLDVHEPPYFNEFGTDILLEPGMIMTVEPGIYLPGVGGVRIEDDVLVTEDGSRVLSDYPKDLSSALIEPALSGSRVESR